MDGIQNLKNRLIIKEKVNPNALPIIDKPKEVHYLAFIENFKIEETLRPVENLDSVPQVIFEEEKERLEDTEFECSQLLRKSRSTLIEKSVDLNSLYQEILMSKVFDKFFQVSLKADLAASNMNEIEMNGDSINFQKLLVYNRIESLIYLITIADSFKLSDEWKAFRVLPDLICEYFEFLGEGNYIIIGNRGIVVLWNISENRVENYHKIAFKSLEDSITASNIKEITNYKSQIIQDQSIDLFYNLGCLIFNIKISIEDKYFAVETNYCDILNTPSYIYTNIKDSIIVAITTDKNQIQKVFMKSIIVINAEDMQIVGNYTNNSIIDFISNIHFKFSGTSTNMQIKIIREYQCSLYLRNVDINTEFVEINNDQKLRPSSQQLKTKLNVNFWPESAVMPEFFLKNEVKRIEDSILSSLYIEYYSVDIFGGTKKKVQALMDFNLETEIKRFEEFNSGSFLVQDKLLMHYYSSFIKVYSLSSLKIDPFLEIKENEQSALITKITISQPFVFISTDSDMVHCFKILLTAKGSISPELTVDDIEYIDRKLPSSKKKKIIAALCEAKDDKNLKIYLDWKLNNLTPENFEPFPLKRTIDNKSLACTEILLQHIVKIDKTFKKAGLILEEIENNFEDIISSSCQSVPSLLNMLLRVEIENGTPKSDFLPIYKNYDFRDSSLKGYFFGNASKNDKDYYIKNSLIKVPDLLGTRNSLKFTKYLCQVTDMKVFGSELIRMYIRSKWVNTRLSLLIMTFLMWLNLYVVYCLISKNRDEIYFYLFVFINSSLIATEVIQAANLGIQEYLGIYNINYSSVFQLITSFVIVFYYSHYLMVVLFIIFQAFTVNKIFSDGTFASSLSMNCILQLPLCILVVTLFFTSNPVYFLVIIGIAEQFFYVSSYLTGDILLGMRLCLQCVNVIFFVIYSIESTVLLVFNMIVLLYEVLYLLKLLKCAELKKDHLFDLFICTISKLLILIAYFTSVTKFALLSLLATLLYSIGRACFLYMQVPEYKNLEILNVFCFRFSLYFVFAFLLTDINAFGYCFIIFNIFEFICLRSLSFKTLLFDSFQLVFNWNSVDVLRYAISVIWIIQFKLLEAKSSKTDSEVLPDKFLTWVFVFFSLSKALHGFKAFDLTRFYIRLIFRCIIEVIPFLVIFAFFTFAYGLLNVVNKSEASFQIIWVGPFDQSVGGFEHDESGSNIEYFMFLLGTLLIVIIMLNLLISILGDTFGRFLVEAKQIDYKVMIETVYEVEVLLFWRKNQTSVKYLACCDKIVPDGEEAETEWQKKLGSLEESLQETKLEVSNQNFILNSKLDEILTVLKKTTDGK